MNPILIAVDDGTLPLGGSTGCCHETSAAFDEAARWLATAQPRRPAQAVEAIRRRFGLPIGDCCQVACEAQRIIAHKG